MIQDIAKIGKKGELKNVSDGYARNFLLPKKLVKIATPEAISEALRKKEKESQAENQKNLRQLSDSIRQKKITLRAKEKKGKLFGSIGTKEIQNALKIENITIEERSIILETPIKKVGEHKIKIRLANGIETDIILAVEGSK